jgi:hypothetical protein
MSGNAVAVVLKRFRIDVVSGHSISPSREITQEVTSTEPRSSSDDRFLSPERAKRRKTNDLEIIAVSVQTSDLAISAVSFRTSDLIGAHRAIGSELVIECLQFFISLKECDRWTSQEGARLTAPMVKPRREPRQMPKRCMVPATFKLCSPATRTVMKLSQILRCISEVALMISSSYDFLISRFEGFGDLRP